MHRRGAFHVSPIQPVFKESKVFRWLQCLNRTRCPIPRLYRRNFKKIQKGGFGRVLSTKERRFQKNYGDPQVFSDRTTTELNLQSLWALDQIYRVRWEEDVRCRREPLLHNEGRGIPARLSFQLQRGHRVSPTEQFCSLPGI